MNKMILCTFNTCLVFQSCFQFGWCWIRTACKLDVVLSQNQYYCCFGLDVNHVTSV